MTTAIIRDLGDGLILRRATAADAEALVEFNANMHCPLGGPPDQGVAAWVRDLMTRPHPTSGPGDFCLVEDDRSHTVVSSLCLIPQTWAYGGIEFGVGRPELVGTLAEYRNRGLVRAQFEEIHRWSAAAGHKLQAITGIPYFYRQFGYEMTLALDSTRTGYLPNVPPLKEGEPEPYHLRRATEADIPFLAQTYAASCRRWLVTVPRGEDLWRYTLSGLCAESCHHAEVHIIEASTGDALGYLMHAPRLHGANMVVGAYELNGGVSWSAVTPSVIRYLRATGEAYAARDGKGPFGAYVFALDHAHPVFQSAPYLFPRQPLPYAWYVRIADVPDFLRTITPVLELRLMDSVWAGHSAELKFTFFRSGFRMVLEQGRITTVEVWKPAPREGAQARFPGLTFLQLLLGYRALEELEYAFPDCRANADCWGLVNTLFPKQPSQVWGII